MNKRISRGSMKALLLRRSSTGAKLSKIAKYINRKNWRSLTEYLSTDDGHDDALKNGTSYTDPSNGDFFLHSACRLHPPVNVVKDLVRVCKPGAVSNRNNNMQTPLHVASAHGASPHVIDFLVRMYPKAVTMQDDRGRTPIHLYCEHCCLPETCDPGNQNEQLVKGPLMAVIQILCHAGLSAVNIEDEDDMTPLEYCISNGADVKVVRSLQKASAKAWKRMQKVKSRRDANSRALSQASGIKAKQTNAAAATASSHSVGSSSFLTSTGKSCPLFAGEQDDCTEATSIVSATPGRVRSSTSSTASASSSMTPEAESRKSLGTRSLGRSKRRGSGTSSSLTQAMEPKKSHGTRSLGRSRRKGDFRPSAMSFDGRRERRIEFRSQPGQSSRSVSGRSVSGRADDGRRELRGNLRAASERHLGVDGNGHRLKPARAA